MAQPATSPAPVQVPVKAKRERKPRVPLTKAAASKKITAILENLEKDLPNSALSVAESVAKLYSK